ncbi:MAG: hypothetical protein NTY64_00860 [Deltaproteobacteria bacterium]|nr:hypothetical protein [Deltaproteobacteria bacterium]
MNPTAEIEDRRNAILLEHWPNLRRNYPTTGSLGGVTPRAKMTQKPGPIADPYRSL